jgi:hypothetical protein
LKRLDNVANRPNLAGARHGFGIGRPREEHHRRERWSPADSLGGLEPVHLTRQGDVDEHEVWMFAGGAPNGVGAIDRGIRHLQASPHELALNGDRDRPIVFDDQHARAGKRRDGIAHCGMPDRRVHGPRI